MRYTLLLVALLCSTPALAQRGAGNGSVRPSVPVAVTSNRASTTTDWRWMTSGIRAGEALWRNFWQGGHAGATQRHTLGRQVRANSLQRNQFGRDERGGTPNILTGASRRVDILTGRPID